MFDSKRYDLELLHCVFDVLDIHGRVLGTICAPGYERALERAKELFEDRVFTITKSFKEITC